MINEETLERLVRSKRAIDSMILHAQIALEHDKYFKGLNVDRDTPAYLDAILMQLGQIGEACSRFKLPEETREEYPHINWRQIKGFRNEAYHRYERLDYDIDWLIVDELLEDLILDLEEVSKDLESRIRCNSFVDKI